VPTPIFTVDAFTNEAFSGNPAAVCLLDHPRDECWLQAVAAEMNLSETAFVHPEGDGYRLRWFTPVVEVNLCGHATLAAAHVLWETGRRSPTSAIRFHTRSGVLTTAQADRWIELDFPALPVQPCPEIPELSEALGTRPVFIGNNGMDLLCQVENEQTVRKVDPDVARLKSIRTRGVIVTAASREPGFDFVSRFFAPAVGVPEDPVCGSSHCASGPFWAERLGKTDLLAYQASQRGGIIRVRVRGQRVRLGGQAVTVMRGELGG
jgi:PhzF family phenazine biosynthesis protein